MTSIKIAGDLTIQNWYELRSALDENNSEHWSTAFGFFEQRMNTRYVNPINHLLELNLNAGEGFAVVNLQCSLIETIESFYNGWIYKHPHFYNIDSKSRTAIKNNDIFISFFSNRAPFKISLPQIDGNDFYRNVRCGLLHETQTKAGWVIMKSHSEKFYNVDGKRKIIYRTNFQVALQAVIDSYRKSIVGDEDGDRTTLRRNLKEKINHICEMSKI